MSRAPRVDAEVEHDTLDLALALGLQRLEGPPEIGIGPLLKLGQPDVAVALLEQLRLDAPDLDDLARD